MWADVSMKLYPALPGQRGFSFPLCAERQPRPRVRPRRAWNDRRPSRLATGLFWRELIADRRGGHYRSSSTERILIRFIGDRLRDRPPVKFRCPRTRSRRDCVARAPRTSDRASELISWCRPFERNRPSSTESPRNGLSFSFVRGKSSTRPLVSKELPSHLVVRHVAAGRTPASLYSIPAGPRSFAMRSRGC